MKLNMQLINFQTAQMSAREAKVTTCEIDILAEDAALNDTEEKIGLVCLFQTDAS